MSGFVSIQTSPTPSWLSRASGFAWNAVFGAFKDAHVRAAKEAVKLRFPDRCPPDALPACAADRSLDIGFGESGAQMRRRLLAAWPTWFGQGSIPGMQYALALCDYAGVMFWESTDDAGLAWWEFDVWLTPPFNWIDHWLDDGLWGDSGVWDDGGVWPEDMPPIELELIRATIEKFRPKHSRCRRIAVVHDADFWDEGTWDDGSLWDENVSYFTP